MLRLVEIQKDGATSDKTLQLSEFVNQVLSDTAAFYERSGFMAPWGSYLGVDTDQAVGVCSFKSKPSDHKVEIAYFTFPEFEGRGIASLMVEALLKVAYGSAPHLKVTARTLTERGASHRVLEKNGFVMSGRVQDPEDGEVLEWVHMPGS